MALQLSEAQTQTFYDDKIQKAFCKEGIPFKDMIAASFKLSESCDNY